VKDKKHYLTIRKGIKLRYGHYFVMNKDIPITEWVQNENKGYYAVIDENCNIKKYDGTKISTNDIELTKQYRKYIEEGIIISPILFNLFRVIL